MNTHTHQAQAGTQAIDPICGMTVTPGQALEESYDGVAYYFCSQHCAEKFSANPNQYIQTEAFHSQDSGGCCQAKDTAMKPAAPPIQESGGCCQ